MPDSLAAIRLGAMEAMLDSQSTLAEEPVGIETSYPSPREGPELGAECTDTEETVLKEPALPVPVVPEHGSNSEEEDEGLPILTRRTKVLVTGNARTRKALLGKTGVVEKATGLGGWHWLVSPRCCIERDPVAREGVKSCTKLLESSQVLFQLLPPTRDCNT